MYAYCCCEDRRSWCATKPPVPFFLSTTTRALARHLFDIAVRVILYFPDESLRHPECACSTRLVISRPIARQLVAAGEGALRTCVTKGDSEFCSRLPVELLKGRDPKTGKEAAVVPGEYGIYLCRRFTNPIKLTAHFDTAKYSQVPSV
jgi:hypothetical protein